jgi:NhaP-type Na+/H+ or K+/H+ antiporter
MDTPRRRHLIALGFALFWSTFMVLWSGDYGIVNIVILVACGLLVGYLWVWAMGRILRRREASSR